MDKLEEAIRKVEEAVKSTGDALDVSNARLICTLSSVAVNTVLRELEIQLRREELFNEMASLSSPEFAEVVQMEADAVGPEPEQGVVQMNNDQNECKFFSRDENGYCDVPDVHKKHCPVSIVAPTLMNLSSCDSHLRGVIDEHFDKLLECLQNV